MQPGISTHVFFSQRLNPGLLDGLRKAGARSVEIFAARHHFDYTDRAAVREIGLWFRANGVSATLHQPLYLSDRADAQWSRHVEANLNLIDPEKSRRIAAMDEVKRAIECAEQIPMTACVLHLGQKDETWNPRALENSLTAIEHLQAFAHPLGVSLLLENLQNEITTPEHLVEIVRVGHFDRVGFCFDVGHAHLVAPERNTGVDAAFVLMRPRIRQLHLHDNHGAKDDHLWPGAGSIDWANVPGVLEIAYQPEESPEAVAAKSSSAFDLLARAADTGANKHL